MNNEKYKPFKTKKNKWWYISKKQKHGRNEMWIGPFDSEAEAEQAQNKEDTTT